MAAITAGIVVAVGQYLGGRKKKKAAQKVREEQRKMVDVTGAEQRRDIAYEAELARWTKQRDAYRRKQGLNNYGALAKSGAPAPNFGGAQPAFIQRWGQGQYQTVGDAGAMPAPPTSLEKGIR
jgi:hypothetical protein